MAEQERNRRAREAEAFARDDRDRAVRRQEMDRVRAAQQKELENRRLLEMATKKQRANKQEALKVHNLKQEQMVKELERRKLDEDDALRAKAMNEVFGVQDDDLNI